MKRIRHRLGLTPQQLAQELGIDRTRIVRYENGTDPIPHSREKALENVAKLQGAA